MRLARASSRASARVTSPSLAAASAGRDGPRSKARRGHCGGPNSPRRRVIGTMTPCHSPNHIPPVLSAHRSVPCLLDESCVRQEAGGPHCAARSAGSDPPKTRGSTAQWVFPNHTHRGGSLPANGSFLEGARRRSFCARGAMPAGVGYREVACDEQSWPGSNWSTCSRTITFERPFRLTPSSPAARATTPCRPSPDYSRRPRFEHKRGREVASTGL